MQCSTSPVCCLELVPLSVLKAEHASHQLAVLLWHLLLTFGGLRNSASWSLPVSTRATYKSALCTFRQPQAFMSFLSVEPQSRVLLESHSDSLLGQFNTQLGIITDRYLAFFQERSLNLVRVLHFTLTVRSSGDILRQPSQLSFDRSNLPRIWAHLFLLKYRFTTETPS